MTTRARYVFVVKEFPNGQPWLVLELLTGPGLSILERGFLGFDLKEGTTLTQAKELAERLNDAIPTISYTE